MTSQMPRVVHKMAADRIATVRSGSGPEEIIHRFEAEVPAREPTGHLMYVLLKGETILNKPSGDP